MSEWSDVDAAWAFFAAAIALVLALFALVLATAFDDTKASMNDGMEDEA